MASEHDNTPLLRPIKVYTRMILADILILILIPIALVLGASALLIGCLLILYFFPRSIYRTYKYKAIIVKRTRPKDMEKIQAFLDFYYHHQDDCSELAKAGIEFLDKLIIGKPQQYVEYRYRFCVFFGILCEEAEKGNIKNNQDVLEYLDRSNFESCHDPRNYWRTLYIEDIRLFKEI